LKLPKLLAAADIKTRWQMPRQGVHRRIKQDPDFPQPVMRVANGAIALFLESDIIDYEQKKPWVADPKFREARRNWIYANKVGRTK
jgi:hypothetical protein